MIRIHLSAEQREELRSRTPERGIDPRTRGRLEMVQLANAGWNIPPCQWPGRSIRLWPGKVSTDCHETALCRDCWECEGSVYVSQEFGVGFAQPGRQGRIG